MKEYIVKGRLDNKTGFMSFTVKQELIRCRDCKHRDEETANCTRFRKDWYVQSDSFCSWAERRGEKE